MHITNKIYKVLHETKQLSCCFGPSSTSETLFLLFCTLSIFVEQESNNGEEVFLFLVNSLL